MVSYSCCGMFGVEASEAGSLSSQPQGEQRETDNASGDEIDSSVPTKLSAKFEQVFDGPSGLRRDPRGKV